MAKTVEQIVADAVGLFEVRHHCSEAIAIATAQYYLDPYPAVIGRISCPFGGGVGGCEDELCGLLSGAVIALGAIWGRDSYTEDDAWLYELVREFRDLFVATNGTTVCRPMRAHYKEGGGRCTPMVEVTTRQLVELIERVASERPEAAAKLARRAILS